MTSCYYCAKNIKQQNTPCCTCSARWLPRMRRTIAVTLPVLFAVRAHQKQQNKYSSKTFINNPRKTYKLRHHTPDPLPFNASEDLNKTHHDYHAPPTKRKLTSWAVMGLWFRGVVVGASRSARARGMFGVVRWWWRCHFVSVVLLRLESEDRGLI